MSKMINNGVADEKHFSQGLRVLAIDDNVVCLKVLASELQRCGYQVTITTKADEAIEILRKNKDGYDIVITDVIRSDMDVFQLLEIIGLEMDIPVIMTSANSDMKIIEKGIKHGARDYLVKPVRIEILRNIWQHVMRKTTYNPRPAQKIEANRRSTRDIVLYKRNHRGEDREATHQNPNEVPLVHKKPRLNWTPELNAKFVTAVQQLGEGAVPMKILKLMNEPQLTRENIASHLQKYRSSLLKQKENLRQESKNRLDANRIRHFCGANVHASSPNNHSFHAMNLCNTYGEYVNKSFRSQKPLLLHPNHHHPDLFLQKNDPLVPAQSQDVDQIRQTMTVPVLNQTPILAIDPHIQPDLDAMKYQPIQYRRITVNDYEQIPPQIPPSAAVGTTASRHPGFVTACSGGNSSQTNRPFNGILPYPCASGALINHTGTSIHMSGNATGQTTLFSQYDSVAGLLLPSSLPAPGHHEARNLATFSGKGGQDFRREARATGPSVDMRGQVDGSTANEHIIGTQFLLNNSDRDIHCQHMNGSCLDDYDLSAIVSRFSEDAAPNL